MPATREFTTTELAKFDGSDPVLPIYVAIKGQVYDVTKSRDMYTPPKGYSCFAGKDASRALGMSSVNIKDCVADYSTLNEEEMKTLEKWVDFYTKKYEIVGIVKS